MSRRAHNQTIESVNPNTGKVTTLQQFDAETRKITRELRTPQQQLAELDRRLGVGVGATRERARLAKLASA